MTLGPNLLPAKRLPGTLPWAIAATGFLTVIALAAALGLARAGQALARVGADRATLYIVDADRGRRDARAAQALAAIRALPGIAAATRVPDREVVRLLQPTLGADTLADLPLPALIDLRLAGDGDSAAIDRAVARLPDVGLTRGDASLAPIATLVTTLGRLAALIATVAILATALVATLAARTALEAHGATIATLHALGASNRAIATLVQQRIAREAFIGGGVGLAAGLVTTGLVVQRIAAIDAGLGVNSGLGLLGWLILCLAPLGLALLATITARVSVLRRLERSP